MMPMWDGLDAL